MFFSGYAICSKKSTISKTTCWRWVPKGYMYPLGTQRQQVVLEIVDFLEQIAYPEKNISLLLGAGVMVICFLALLLGWQLKKSFKDS